MDRQELERALVGAQPAQIPWVEIGIGSGGAPAFQNSWVNYDLTIYSSSGFYKDQFGIVWLRGVVKSGIMGTAILTLPGGFRPHPQRVRFPSNNGGTLGVVEVHPNGNVIPTTGTNAHVPLDMVRFRAGQ